MAITTVTTWCDNPGDVTAEGLTIGGIQVTHAELLEIHDREGALFMGVTQDLITIWEYQGGRDFGQLVDWLYQYAEATNQRTLDETDETQRSPRPKDAYLTRIGPIILLQTRSEEFYASMQIAYNQAGSASCVLTRWDIDGEATCQQLVGNNRDWPRFWTAFLAFLPADVAAEIRSEAEFVRY
jgi:hypothetical protein